MRIKYTIKNSVYAIVSYFLLLIVGLLVRKVFLQNLPIEYLGYEGLFGNIFGILALADLGIEALILYRMFPAFVEENYDKINKLMSIYSWLYKWVGICVACLGLILIPFLPAIISDNALEWKSIVYIYIIQLLATLCTYFLAYKRLMFSVSQKEYECTKVDTMMTFIFSGLKIFVLIFFKSYYLFLLCNLCINISGNIIISIKVKKQFPYLTFDEKVKFENIKGLGIGKDMKNNLFQKICLVIYGGTDNILVSWLFGISQVGVLANYTLLQGYVTNFFMKLLKPFQMSIGNYIYSEEKERGCELFRMFDLISFFLASIITCCYTNLFNPFIQLWIGKEYLLSFGFVLAFSVNQYIGWNQQFITYYRYSFGKYELDRWFILGAALINIVISIFSGMKIGITGVMIGTAIGHMGFWIGRVYVVYTEYINENVMRYIFRQIERIIILSIEMAICLYVCNMIPISWGGIILRIIVCVFVPACIGYCSHLRSTEIRSIWTYIKKIVQEIFSK